MIDQLHPLKTLLQRVYVMDVPLHPLYPAEKPFGIRDIIPKDLLYPVSTADLTLQRTHPVILPDKRQQQMTPH